MAAVFNISGGTAPISTALATRLVPWRPMKRGDFPATREERIDPNLLLRAARGPKAGASRPSLEFPARSDSHLDPIELLFRPVERVVADVVSGPHVKDDPAGLHEREAVDLLVCVRMGAAGQDLASWVR